MAKIPVTRQGKEFQLRPGSPLFADQGWRGVNTELDPGSLSPNELQRAENIRLRGKIIVSRRGQTQRASLGVGGTQVVSWIKEEPSDNPRQRLWMSAVGCFGGGIGTGGSVSH